MIRWGEEKCVYWGKRHPRIRVHYYVCGMGVEDSGEPVVLDIRVGCTRCATVVGGRVELTGEAGEWLRDFMAEEDLESEDGEYAEDFIVEELEGRLSGVKKFKNILVGMLMSSNCIQRVKTYWMKSYKRGADGQITGEPVEEKKTVTAARFLLEYPVLGTIDKLDR